MKHSHGNNSKHTIGKQIVKGSMASASVGTGGKIVGKLAKHPILLFGLGVATGYMIYKYRKEIVSNVGKATDASKDFVLQQKENLEDIVAETKEDT